jgi:hypothetical protein
VPGRRDGQLLAGDLEQQRTVEVHGRQLVQPRPGVELWPRVDDPLQHRVGRTQVGSRAPEPCGSAGVVAGDGAHMPLSSREVRMMLTTSATVSVPDQLRSSSQASETQLIG